MIIINIFREFCNCYCNDYDLCTCGYIEPHNFRNEKCPNCGAKRVDCKQYIKKLATNIVADKKIESKSFYVKKIKCVTDIEFKNNLPVIRIIKHEVWETSFDFMNNCELIIRLNGDIVNNTKSNIQHALSYTDLTFLDQLDNSLFRSIADYTDTYTSSSIIQTIISNKFLEIFYNTYGSLKVIEYIPTSKMNANATSPAAIVGLNRAVWRKLTKIINEHGSSINRQFANIKYLNDKYPDKPDYVISIIDKIYDIGINYFSYYVMLLQDGWNHDRLYKYLSEDIYTYQGISSISDGLMLLKDYVSMCKEMGVEYEKYPKSLKLAHDLASKNMKIKVSNEKQQQFNSVINDEEYKNLTYKGIYYSVILPTSTNDIIDEGRKLHHCVGSYVNRVIDGKTKILFFRNNSEIHKPLITLEVKNNMLMQYRGNQNRQPNQHEMEEIQKYAIKKGLTIF